MKVQVVVKIHTGNGHLKIEIERWKIECC